MRRALDKDIQTASQVKGLDILITGHAHVGTPEPIKVAIRSSSPLTAAGLMWANWFSTTKRSRIILR